MLGKVLRQDMRSSAKMFFPLYAMIFAVTGLAVVTSLVSGKVENQVMAFVSGGTIFLYVLALLAASVLPAVFIVMFFYRCFLTDEAYLNCTLPIKTSTQVISKQINGVFWMLLSAIVSISAILLLLGGILGEDWRDIVTMFREIWEEIGDAMQEFLQGIWDGETSVLSIVYAVVAIVFAYTRIYAAMAIGQLYTKHKIVGSILAYLGLSMAFGTVGQYASMTLMYSDTMNPYLIYAILMQVAEGVICMAITIYFLKNKLNLE